MNLKIIISIFLIVIIHTVSYSQINDTIDYKITYELEFKELKNSELKQKEKMFLFISKNHSKFISEGKYKIDSLMASENVKQLSFSEFMRNIPKTKFDFFVINVLGSNKILFHQKILKDKFFYEESINHNWTNHKNTKQILGYNCKKATVSYQGRNYTAWYSNDIPVSTGPYKFYGLPGLIFEIYDSKKEYHFLIKGIESLSNEHILNFNPKNYIQVSKKDYEQTKEKLNENPIKMLEQSGISLDFSNELQKKSLIDSHKEKMKNNNPIELKDDGEKQM
ncbi:GLPGLI family protein [Polaribacter cellanae]|uniref:GLPGLI family protein n=1 Tax=Polaribacter cellanae TaxID=2818493 RepID=A0A975CKJ2_9FLAO|nr:GLPGLI family protein [Polaribacter cellanae]QTE21423.1 GLPGLI family protein [Polaribacter cellanae]